MPVATSTLVRSLGTIPARLRHALGRRRRSDRGEGVLSAAIAVLIFAFLGTVMWYGFKATFSHAQTKTDTQVEQIGK